MSDAAPPPPPPEDPSSDELLAELYDELKRLAERLMRGERANHTLSATALVHDAWERLGDRQTGWADRRQFVAAVFRTMRRILIDHARHHGRLAQGGHLQRITLGADLVGAGIDPAGLLALDEALEQLAMERPRAHDIVLLHHFAQFPLEEIRERLGVSRATVQRDHDFAKRFLRALLDDDALDAAAAPNAG